MATSSFRKPSDRPPPPRPTGFALPEIPVSRTSNASKNSFRPSPLPSLGSFSGASTTIAAASSHDASSEGPKMESRCDACECLFDCTWNCSYCDMSFCDECWHKQGPHKPGRKGPDGLPHEKADPAIVQRLKEILNPSADLAEQQSLHVKDEDTAWFGVGKDNAGGSILEDFGRYSTIMQDSNTGDHRLRYPRLVSFIGQTGAGKSTLIKMLIDQQERLKNYYRKQTFPSPIAGSIRNENVPTSGDVHLYADPKHYFGEYPLLYADCEGLEGGEIDPVSVQLRNKGQASSDHNKRKKIKVRSSSQRKLDWADRFSEKSKRQYAVTELYPRLLYTFSDVIVFVLRNSKTFESSVLSKLIEWASASMEKSLNQPTLPHAVIALNATDMGVDENEWDPKHATASLMSAIADAIHRHPTYTDKAEFWMERGKKIRTTQDLLECYYSSITVVRIPVKGRYMKINEQVLKLHEELNKKCAESYRAKRRSRMLSNAEELNVYLQCAFDHFAHDLETPFNFMDVGFKMSSIPLDLGGNILKLAVKMKESGRFYVPRTIFSNLSFMVASCISLDIVRQSLKGSPEQILRNFYLDSCDHALDDFCALFWPCTFTNKKGRCVNVAERHTKGHQNDKGHIIGTGPYESAFNFESFSDEWLDLLQNYIREFQGHVQQQLILNSTGDELTLTTTLHLTNVKKFYDQVGGSHKFISHSVCLCCLRGLAEHPLPCGHVLCTQCIKGYGSPTPGIPTMYAIASCPLHYAHDPFPDQWGVHFKPELAGVRILSMDGGGIRGIVILEVLRQIEIELGKRIPVQDFFDLIVGTSTGGIIALGIGIKNWSIDHAIALFTKLVDRAFTHKFAGTKLLGNRKYKTGPLEQCLREVFKDDPIFGGKQEHSVNYGRKVVVTASTETAEQAVIFTNYSRPDDEQVSYHMERPDDQTHELRLWEAARATSAAPTFFKPFKNSRTRDVFIDGAIFHNNPVRIANYESKLLWPDAEEFHPDILLSIGTAHNGENTEGTPTSTSGDRRRAANRNRLTKAPPRNGPGFKPFSEVQSWINVMFKRMDDILDAESIWKDFRKDVITNTSRTEISRYIRINPWVKTRTPKMDEKREMGRLDEEVKAYMSKTSTKNSIRAIAYRLVASTFYFERSGPPREADDFVTVQGTIICRFPKGSDNLRNLGTYLQNCQQQSFQPYFKIHEVGNEASSQRVELGPEIISVMIVFGYFDVKSIAIPISSKTGCICINLHLTNEPTYVFPISGFPRNLADTAPLKRTTSPGSPHPSGQGPGANIPRTNTKRQSVRRKRALRPRLSDMRPASHGSSDSYDFPETPSDVSDWTRRRNEAKRPAPKGPMPMDNAFIYELDGTASLNSSLLEGDDDGLMRAMERSEVENRPPLERTYTGTDEEELARALKLSLYEQ